MQPDRLPETVCDFLRGQAQETPAIAACASRIADSGWQTTHWQDYLAQIERLAQYLVGLGIRPGDRLALLGPPCQQWQSLEFAGLLAGAVIVGIESRSSAFELTRLLEQSAPRGLMIHDDRLLAGIEATVLSNLNFVRTWSAEKSVPDLLAAWSQAGTAAGPDRNQLPELSADSPATIIFTSGTTGEPKAIEYTHGQMMAACRAIARELPQLEPGDRTICWLPLAHLFQRVMNLVFLSRGMSLYFLPDPRQILEVVREVEPAALIGVPRFYEKLYEGIQQKLASQHGWRNWLAKRSLAIANQRGHALRSAEKPGLMANWWFRCVDRLVLQRIRDLLGSKIKFMFTGSAPINPSILEFFQDIGWTVLEAYGISENAIPMSSNRPHSVRIGSVGRPFLENDLKLADDSEILVRGYGVFDGYRGESNEESTARFTSDGYYRTGDLGKIDEDGFLYLIGRKSDLIKTSTGRKIAPQSIEANYAASPLFDQVVVFGNNRPFLSGLISLNEAELARRLPNMPHWITSWNGQEVLAPEALACVQAEWDERGLRLAAFERVQRFAVLREPLSIEQGELTPTLKVRRKMIESRHHQLIADLYASTPEVAS